MNANPEFILFNGFRNTIHLVDCIFKGYETHLFKKGRIIQDLTNIGIICYKNFDFTSSGIYYMLMCMENRGD
jgi:hypothetical protein